MKKYLKVCALALSLTTLFSCSQGEDSSLKVYTDASYSFMNLSCETGDYKQVYAIGLNVDNRNDKNVTLTNTDFKVSSKSKEYTCLYFVIDYDITSHAVKTFKTTVDIIPSDTGDTVKQSQIFVAFSNEIDTTSYTISYKGTTLKDMGA